MTEAKKPDDFPPPFWARRSAEALERYSTFHDGFPKHLHNAIERWFVNWLYCKEFWIQLQFIENFELRCQRHVRDFVAPQQLREILSTEMGKSADFALDLLDHAATFLHGLGERGANALRQLEDILRAGRSKYMVNPAGPGLTNRVSDDVVAMLAEALDAGTRASEHIGRSWTELHGRKPNTSTAYREAVKAVESLLVPEMDAGGSGTLGRVIGNLRTAPQRLKVAFTAGTAPKKTIPETTLTAAETVVAMLDLLWSNQHERHGGDETTPLDATPHEAEAALYLALLLTTWHHRGLLSAKK
jgi:hypothetical protein